MTQQNLGRGRPKGDGVDDSARLARVADALVANPSLSPSSAMRQTDPAPNQSDLRRLQGKWKKRKQELLQAAEARAAERREREAVSRRSGASPSYDGGLSAHVARMDKIAKIMQGRDASPLGRYFDALENNPAMRVAMGLDDSPATKLMKQIENSPTMRLARALEDSPTGRMIRAIEDSPTMRLARHMDQFRLRGW